MYVKKIEQRSATRWVTKAERIHTRGETQKATVANTGRETEKRRHDNAVQMCERRRKKLIYMTIQENIKKDVRKLKISRQGSKSME